MNRFRFILLLYISFSYNIIYAETPAIAKQFLNHKDWSFIENKGQVGTTEIKYYGHQGGVYLYCQTGKISFVFTNTKKEIREVSEATSQPFQNIKSYQRQPSTTITNQADLIFIHADQSAGIIASEGQGYYENYYTTGNADSGITHVHTYKTLTYKNIYPNIDMVLHAIGQGIKYEFIVYPGGKVSDIQLQWNGFDNIKMIENGGIFYAMALGNMMESNPVSFQGKKGIGSAFILKNNRIGFETGRYDKSRTLVIDPTLNWGTYFGGSGYNEGTGVTIDAFGNVYMTGYSDSRNGIATSGVHQTSYGGGNDDAFLAKFSNSGSLLWATYYGGSSIDEALGLNTDGLGNIFITGITESSSGIATVGSYQTSLAGTDDVFLAKFSSSGSLTWATYFGGGNGINTGNGVSTDASGNIYLTGTTYSNVGIATSGIYQTSLAGTHDAFLAKFSSTGSLFWATYYGGSINHIANGANSATGVSTDSSGNIYIVGWTDCNVGIATAGAYQTALTGYTNTFLAKFSGSGGLLWATYYGGRSTDEGLGICTDGLGNIYITGYTESSSGIATTGAYQTSNIGGFNTFLAKFNSYGSLLWATYYGGIGINQGIGVSADDTGNVYITGLTTSKNFIATTGAYQTSNAGGATGNYNSFLAKFSSTSSLLWATYYGGNGGDEGLGVIADHIGNVYMTGLTGSKNGIATSGAYQTLFSGPDDAFLVKFASPILLDAGIDSIISPSVNSCKDSVPIVVQLKNYGQHTLTSVLILTAINGKLQTPYSWSGNIKADSSSIVNIGSKIFPTGIDTIKVWTSAPNGVTDTIRTNDTAKAVLKVYPLPNANAGPDTVLCYNESYMMQGSGGITYTWHPATYLSSATNPKAIAKLPNTEQYELIVANSIGCIDSASVLLKVRPKLQVKATVNDTPVCYGQSIILSAKGKGGDSLHYHFHWANHTVNGDSLTETAYQSGWYKITLSDNCTPDSVSDSVNIKVTPPARAAFTWSPTQYDIRQRPVSFINQSANSSSYLWTFGAKDSSKLESPVYIFTDTGDAQLRLVAYGLNGCPNDTAFGFIKIINDQVTIYIPNAFSPNGDGINDEFHISGIGITSCSFNIYNRWGEHIFEGNGAWDGTFNGEQVPEGIYIYMLDVVDILGYHHYLSGNLTLIR